MGFDEIMQIPLNFVEMLFSKGYLIFIIIALIIIALVILKYL
jgi:hypothetical protein